MMQDGSEVDYVKVFSTPFVAKAISARKVIQRADDIEWSRCEVKRTDPDTAKLGLAWGVFCNNQLITATAFRDVADLMCEEFHAWKVNVDVQR